jgi:hypothetical protein
MKKKNNKKANPKNISKICRLYLILFYIWPKSNESVNFYDR